MGGAQVYFPNIQIASKCETLKFSSIYTFEYSETCLKWTPNGYWPLNRGVRLVQVYFTGNKGRKIGLY